jgi:hypothetical protein
LINFIQSATMLTHTILLLFGVLVIHFQATVATYSIAGTDKSTGQVGGIGASCVSLDIFRALYSSIPGKGVLLSQGYVPENQLPRNLGLVLLQNETDPTDIINAIIQLSVDPLVFVDEFPGPDIRQYGVVDLQGRVAGHTGASLETLYEERLGIFGTVQQNLQGNVGNFTYAVQGNVVTSSTLGNAVDAFVDGNGCDLADRLMLALVGGREQDGQVEGDFRCVSSLGIAASGAFLDVDNPDGTVFLDLAAVNTAPDDAVVLLQAQYEAWRATCPCAVCGSPVDGATAETSAPASGTVSVFDALLSMCYAATLICSTVVFAFW